MVRIPVVQPDIVPTWFTKCSSPECKARHMVTERYVCNHARVEECNREITAQHVKQCELPIGTSKLGKCHACAAEDKRYTTTQRLENVPVPGRKNFIYLKH